MTRPRYPCALQCGHDRAGTRAIGSHRICEVCFAIVREIATAVGVLIRDSDYLVPGESGVGPVASKVVAMLERWRSPRRVWNCVECGRDTGYVPYAGRRKPYSYCLACVPIGHAMVRIRTGHRLWVEWLREKGRAAA